MADDRLEMYHADEKSRDIQTLFPETRTILWQDPKDPMKVIWLSTGVAYAQTISFSTSIESDKLTDDTQFIPSTLFPTGIPAEINETRVAAILLSIESLANNTGKIIERILLYISFALKTPSTFTDMINAAKLELKTYGIDISCLGQVLKLYEVKQAVRLIKNQSDFWIRVTDGGSQLESATGSLLTAIFGGNFYLVLCNKVEPEDAYLWLKGQRILTKEA